MRIEGVDSPALNKIKEQTQKPEIGRAGEIHTDTQLKKRHETIRGKDVPREDNHTERLEQALKQANKATEAVNISLRFYVHERSDRVMVQVVDIQNNEVIKEIPPEKVLNLVGQIQEMIGLLLDEKR
jgi:flagellar protein FlaG